MLFLCYFFAHTRGGVNFTLSHFERSHRRRLISQHRHRVIPNMNNKLRRTYLKLQLFINKYCMKMLPLLEILIFLNAIFREKVSKNTHPCVLWGGKETGKSDRRGGGGIPPKGPVEDERLRNFGYELRYT